MQTNPLLRRKTWTWILIVLYFAFRIGLLGVYRFVMEMAPPAWVGPTFELAAYLLAALAIAINLDQLEAYKFDRLALGLFVLGKPVGVLLQSLGLPFPYQPPVDLSIAFLIIAAGLLAWLVVRRASIRARGAPRWIDLGLGLAAGLLAALASGLLVRSQQADFIPIQALLGQLLLLPVQQLAYAALSEEPFFRGFLWGALEQAGFKPLACFLVQGLLFWVAHFYYLTALPISFWLIVPLGSVLLGLLVWRSRSISTSMIAHGVMNGASQAIAFYRL